MSGEISPVEAVTLPPKLGDWEADARVWMNVGCSLESTESEGFKAVKITPQSETMNFSIWRDATTHQGLDLWMPEWKSFVFTHASHLSDLESATLRLYRGVSYCEKNILPDLSGRWKTIEYLLPSAAPEGYWNEVGSVNKIEYILFMFSGKSGILSGSFEIKKAHLVRASPKS